MKKLVAILMYVLASNSFAIESTNWFKINQIYVSGGNNLHFRVYGMGVMSYCPEGQGWAYVDENDNGAKGKISALLSAYTAGKDVLLHIEPTDYYGNGKIFCHILELRVRN